MPRYEPLLHPLGIALALAACTPEAADPTPRRTCGAQVWVRPARAGAEVELTGSWDGYRGLVPVPPHGDGWHMLPLDLPPGEHGYLIAEDGVLATDPHNALTTYRGEEEVSLLLVADCASPALRIDSVVAGPAGDVTVEASFLAAAKGGPLDPASVVATTRDGAPMAVTSASPGTGRIRLSASGLARGRHSFELKASDADGRGAAARAAAWVAPLASTFREGLVYQIVIDRFRGDGGAPLPPPGSPASRAGGTLDGVLTEIEGGTFEALGATALWLSPVYVNPIEAREGRDGHMGDGYHGYWPLDSRAVDERIGGASALTAVVSAAHARGLRVLLDLVPNHVYEANPRYVEHAADGWFHGGAASCVCGTTGCGWDTHIGTCWFTPYLPDVRWQSPDATRAAVDDALFWARTFDVDGFRIDAVPMMPRGATRRIAHALRTEAGRRDDTFLLGEVFTGPGQGGIDSIRYHLGPDGLDSAFDFPLMWALRDAFAHHGSFEAVEAVLRDTQLAYAGSGTVRAGMLGNHDTTRFLSELNGDAGGDPWTSPPEVPTSPDVHARHRLALAFLLTSSDMPVLLYGDELGMEGGADPDCRHVMPADDALSAAQRATLDTTRRLGALRSCARALHAGPRVSLVADHDAAAYVRDAGSGERAIVLISKAISASFIALPEAAGLAGAYVDAMTGEAVPIGASSPVAMPALSFRVLLPVGSPCL